MSSLALLAHAAAPPPPAFNGLFYATAATVIPVLFLAIAVQGRTYENLVNAGTAADRRLSEATTWRRRTIAYVSGSVLFVIAGLILVWGVLSEIIAVAALHQQQASGAAGFIVLIGTIFMVIAAAGPPALVFARYAWAPAGELARIRRMREGAGHATGPGSQEPGATTQPETGKTDTEG